MSKLWTAAQVADYLAVRRGTVYAWVKQRAIPHIVLSRGRRKECIRFRPEDLENWLRTRVRKPRNREK